MNFSNEPVQAVSLGFVSSLWKVSHFPQKCPMSCHSWFFSTACDTEWQLYFTSLSSEPGNLQLGWKQSITFLRFTPCIHISAPMELFLTSHFQSTEIYRIFSYFYLSKSTLTNSRPFWDCSCCIKYTIVYHLSHGSYFAVHKFVLFLYMETREICNNINSIHEH